MFIFIFTTCRVCTFRSDVSLHQRQKVKRDLKRMRQKKHKRSREAKIDSSSLSSISIMEKYTLDDLQSLVTAIPALLSAPKFVPRPYMWNPFSFKNSIESRIPSEAYDAFVPTTIPGPGPSKTDVQNEGTPESGCGDVALKSSTTAKRCLFPCIETPGSEFNSPDDKVAEWMSRIDPLHGSDLEYDNASTVVADEEKFGFTLPSWLRTETAPKLVKEDRLLPGIPISEDRRQFISKCNHEVVSQWLRDCAVAEKVGSGTEAPERKAIVSAKESKFQSNAEQMLKSMNALNRYPICQYIEELKAREREAVTTARIFRDKFEKSEENRAKDVLQKNRDILKVRTFWRKNIAEQCCRGGKMVNLSISKHNAAGK